MPIRPACPNASFRSFCRRPSPDLQCLVKVSALNVNPIDIYIRSGAVPTQLKFPYILGRDLAGAVVEAGPEVKRFKPGGRVWATNLGLDGREDTFLEFAAVDECGLHPTPVAAKDKAVVGVSFVGITAQLGLASQAKLKPGEVWFVNGGRGGIGSCVSQMAKIIGARVITTAGGDEIVEAAEKRALILPSITKRKTWRLQ